MRVVELTLVVCLVACKDGSRRSEPSANPPPATVEAGAGSDVDNAAEYDSESLGALRFEPSGGSPAARSHFQRGLLALHSFWYEEAQKQFATAIAADPSFAMAYWGLAMSHAKLLWGDDNLAAGREALGKLPAPNTLPVREQAWVMAALSLFRRAKVDVHTSRKEFLQTMEALHAKFPDDESAVFLSLALLSTIRPNDPDEVSIRQRAAKLASEVFQRNPKHPGAAHYWIHAYDTPELAAGALDAAKLYARIAPAAFHARHMPAHIFARLGMWSEAQTSCEAAWQASVAWAQREQLSLEHHDFHSLAWLVEIPFERGRRADGDRAMTMYADAVTAGLSHEKRAAYANQVASYLARTGEWQRVDELLGRLDAPAVDTAPGATTTSACGHAVPGGSSNALLEKRAVLATRARAAAAKGDVKGVEHALDQRDAVDRDLRPFLETTQPKELLDTVDRLRPFVRRALLARARGDSRALAAALRPLAAEQDSEFIGEGMPGGILHREELAEILSKLGDARGALREYELVLAKHAGRARSLLGAARMAAKVGRTTTSHDYYARLAELWRDADESIDGLAEARTVTQRSNR